MEGEPAPPDPDSDDEGRNHGNGGGGIYSYSADDAERQKTYKHSATYRRRAEVGRCRLTPS
jgi:hypothetical protein